MAIFERSGRNDRDLKWAKIWFTHFTRFHQREGQTDWQFTADDVIGFLRSHLEKGTPAWKRLKIVQGLINYRQLVQKRPTDDLIPIHQKLQEIATRERVTDEGAQTIEEVVGKINPREADVIQDYRRALRLHGIKYSTERAYVGKLKAFMRDRGLQCQG